MRLRARGNGKGTHEGAFAVYSPGAGVRNTGGIPF